MDRRDFLTSAALGAAALPATSLAGSGAGAAPVLLTVSGAIGAGNRGPVDPALDQMMHKHGAAFERAHGFDFATLVALPAQRIRPTLEYDGKVHELSGPQLTAVLEAAGTRPADAARLVLRAVDGYTAELTVGEARRYGFIVATHLDGRPMPLGGLGPLWAVYDADRHPEMMAKSLPERFALCPWAVYHVDVQGG